MENRTYRCFQDKPLYAFGHGLSYTRFKYAGPKFNAASFCAGAGWDGIVLRYGTQGSFGNPASWHSCDAGNIGGLPSRGIPAERSTGGMSILRQR